MAAKRAARKRTPNRGARAALVIAAAIVVLFTFASLIFHYFVKSPNYCGPLGYWVAWGLDVAFGPDNTAIYIQVGGAWARP